MTNAEQETADKQKRQGEIDDIKWIVSDARGRRVINRLIKQTRLFQLSHSGEATHQTALYEGARNVGLFLYGEIIEIAPEKLADIMKGI